MPNEDEKTTVDAKLGEITFRLCRMMLARKVLWDEDLNFDVDKLASSLDTPPEVVVRALSALNAEGWVEIHGECPVLTDRGVAAIRGRSHEGA